MAKNVLTSQQNDIYTTLLNKGGYISGQGQMCRVVDGNHNPVFLCTRKNVDYLVDNGILKKDKLVFILNENHLKAIEVLAQQKQIVQFKNTK